MNYYNQDNIVFEYFEATKENEILLYQYLISIDNSFIPKLSSYLDIEIYSKKLINNACICISKYNGAFVGMAAVYMNNKADKIAYLSIIAVSDQFKGQGVSQILLDQVIKKSQNQGMTDFKLEVNKANARAISFYEKNGFVKTEENTNNPLTIFMYKILNK